MNPVRSREHDMNNTPATKMSNIMNNNQVGRVTHRSALYF